jgi:hypothetical protein
LDMPTLTIFSEDYAADPVADTCLMSYVPDRADIIGSLESSNVQELLYLLGLDQLDNDQIKQVISDIAANTKELVAFNLDTGEYGILVRIGDGINMSDFVSGYLAEIIESINATIEQEANKFDYLVLDVNTVVLAPSAELRQEIALKVEEGNISSECTFYRIDKCSELDSRPILYALMKFDTQFLDQLFEGNLSSLKDSLKDGGFVIGIDMKDGLIHMYAGITDNTDVSMGNVITFLSFNVDADNPIMRLVIDQLAADLLNFE